MAECFWERNYVQIIDTANKTMEAYYITKPNVLSGDRQCWDPESQRSITSPKAFTRLTNLIYNNLKKYPVNCLELVASIFELADLEVIRTTRKVFRKLEINKYSKITKIKIKITKYRITNQTTIITGKKNVCKWFLDYLRSFCSYIKHGERNMKDRRAIAHRI